MVLFVAYYSYCTMNAYPHEDKYDEPNAKIIKEGIMVAAG